MHASLLHPEAISRLLQPFGFESLEQVDACHSVHQYMAHLDRASRGTGREAGPEAGGKQAYAHLEGRKIQSFRHVKLLADVLRGQQRDLIGRAEPTARMLRDFGAGRVSRGPGAIPSAPVRRLLPAVAAASASAADAGPADDLVDPDQPPLRFAARDSIQSSLSPAGYLKHLYDLAKAIDNSTPELNLSQRRPDLADLALSEANLNAELPTLDLANELLLAQLLKAAGPGTTAADIDTGLATSLYPLALPIDTAHSQLRHTLTAMGGSSLNALARVLREQAYALGDTGFTAVPNVLDALNLYQGHLEVLAAATPAASTLSTDWYGVPTDTDLSDVATFQAATGLTPEAFSRLYCIDPVYDAAGMAHASDQGQARYISNYQYRLSFQVSNGRQSMCWVDDGGNKQPLNATILGNMNRMIRLQQRTGLTCAELDRLLQTVQTEADAGVLGTGGSGSAAALEVIARYLYWRERYGLGVDEFVGMLTGINGQYPLGLPDDSLFARLFGNSAGAIAAGTAGCALLGDLPADLAQSLMIGLKVTAADFDALVAALVGASGASTPFDQAALARLYRIVRLCRLFGWPIADTLQLLPAIGLKALLQASGDSAESLATILAQLDTLSWLDDWLEAAGGKLSIDTLITVLTPASALAAGPELSVAAQRFYDGLGEAAPSKLTNLNSFADFGTWESGDDWNETIDDPGIAWLKFLAAGTAGVLDDQYLVNPDASSQASSPALANAIDTILQHSIPIGSGDAITTQAQRQKLCLIDVVNALHKHQQDLLAKTIAEYAGIKSQLVAPLLQWLGLSSSQVLATFLAWDSASGTLQARSPDSTGLDLLYEIDRHAAVVTALDLDGPMLQLAAQQPGLLRTGLAAPLGLEQVYWLQRLKALTQGKVTSAHWVLYLWQVNFAKLQVQDQNWYLSRYLDWPGDDLPNLTSGGADIGIQDGWVKSVQQLDYLRRWIDTCRGLDLRAAELAALAAVNTAATPDYAAAAGAAALALQRRGDPAATANAEGTAAEALRDALLAAFFNTVVAGNAFLRQTLQSAEDVYQYLLLDVNVAYEVPTTRLLEAVGSIQLYINRIIQRVETGNFPGGVALLKTTWETSQLYRLWQANEELALYPSSYIDPALRLGKTTLFKQLEQALQPKSISADGIRQAVVQYINGLSRLAGLTVSAYTVEHGASSITFCFTAKAAWQQNAFYVRTLRVDYGALKLQSPYAYDWSEWRRASLTFASHRVFGVVPCYGWGALHLFWLEVFKTSSAATAEGSGSGSGYSVAPSYYLQLKYCRQDSDGSFGHPLSSTAATPHGILLDGVTDDNVGQVQVQFYQAFFDASDNDPSTSRIALDFQVTSPTGSETLYQSVTQARQSTVARAADQDSSTTAAFTLPGYAPTTAVLNPSGTPVRVGIAGPLPYFLIDTRLGGTADAVRLWFPTDPSTSFDVWPNDPPWMPSADAPAPSTSPAFVSFTATQPAADAPTFEITATLDLLQTEFVGVSYLVETRLDEACECNLFYESTHFTLNLDTSSSPASFDLMRGTDGVFIDIPPFAIQGECTISQGFSPGAFCTKKSLISSPFQLATPAQPYSEHTATVTAQTTWTITTSSCSDIANGTYPSALKSIVVPLEIINVYAFKIEVLASSIAPEQTFLLFQPPFAGQTDVPLATTALYSSAIEQVVQLVNPEYEIADLYTTANQQFAEAGVSAYIDKVEASYSLSAPLPQAAMDFSGCCGLYAWELFYYIPMLVAAKCTTAGQFDLAKQWLRTVYDPTDNGSWHCLPLIPGNAASMSPLPDQGAITDPDLIARQNPEHYRLATIRQYLQNLIAQGDAWYRAMTAETLRQAKLCYVEALGLFDERQAQLEDEAAQPAAQAIIRGAQVLSFDGSSTYVEVPYDPALNPPQFTLSCWARAGVIAPGRWRTIVSMRTNDAAKDPVAGCVLQLSDQNQWYFQCVGSEVARVTSTSAALAQWTHLAATFDGSTMTLYVNGTSAGSNTCEDYIKNTSSALRIGNSNPNDYDNRFFPGEIAQVRLWSQARTQDQIQADMWLDAPSNDPGLLGAWPLNDGPSSAGSVADQSGNGHGGQLQGSTPSWSVQPVPWKQAADAAGTPAAPSAASPSQQRWLLHFNGAGAYVSIPYAQALNPARFTLSCWVFAEDSGAWMTLIDSRSGDATQPSRSGSDTSLTPAGYTLQLSNTSKYFFECNNDGEAGVTSDQAVVVKTWTHVAATYDGATMQLYVNAQPVGSLALTSFTPLRSSAIDLRFGTTTTEWFDGVIADVHIYNAALSATEIQRDMRCAATPDSADLVGCWPLDDNDSTLRDTSGNGHDGRLQGASSTTWVIGPGPDLNQVSPPPADPYAWRAPTLGTVTTADFLLPRNQALQDLYDTLQQRLYNLRHWLSIDGTPLNIPLIAAPINPRELQLAALAGLTPEQAAQAGQRASAHQFEDLLERAKGHVEALIKWSDHLLRFQLDADEQARRSLASSLEAGLLELTVEHQQHRIETAERALSVNDYAKQALEEEIKHLASDMLLGEALNVSLLVLHTLRRQLLVQELPFLEMAGGLSVVPRIFGFSDGGQNFEGTPGDAAKSLDVGANVLAATADSVKDGFAIEQLLAADASGIVKAKLGLQQLEVERRIAQAQVAHEQGVLAEMRMQMQSKQALARFNATRFTSGRFWSWYLDSLKELYQTYFDQTVSFCLLAEQAYQSEADAKTRFIFPQWDASNAGLLSGHKLLLDLQRMELAWAQAVAASGQPTTQNFVLSERAPAALAQLKSRGKALIQVQEPWLDELFPDERGRRLSSLALRFEGLRDADPIAATLRLLSHRQRLKNGQGCGPERYGAQPTLRLTRVQTDTAAIAAPKGRRLPFQGTGIDATWSLAFPAAAKAIAAGEQGFPQRDMLERLEDVVLTLSYTSW
jgi:hypothetical protein